MHALTEQQVRRSFVELLAGRGQGGWRSPRDFADLDWASLELLGWRDPKAPLRGYLVIDTGERPSASRSGPPTRGCPAGRRRCACSARRRRPATPCRCSPRSGPAPRGATATPSAPTCAPTWVARDRVRTEIPPWLQDRDPAEVVAERAAELRERVQGFVDAVRR